MKATNQELVSHLVDLTKKNLERSKQFDTLSEAQLNWKPSPEKWSILECMEHLNRYGDFYIPEFERRFAHAKQSKSKRFRSTWLGEYFAQSVAAQPKLNKMKTFDYMNPVGSKLTKAHLDKFQSQQGQLIEILENAIDLDFNKTKSSISISKWITIKIGDALRVVIYHNERHIEQAEKVRSKIRQT
jgi:hypothetical protein